MSQTTHLTFVQTALGLEPLLSAELKRLLPHLTPPSLSEGGVISRLSTRDLWTTCLASRLAEGVRVRLKAFVARDFTTLEQQFARLPLSAYFARGGRAEVRVVSHRSKLWHSGAVAERVQGVLSSRFSVSVGTSEAGATVVYVRLTGDTVQVSIDAGGHRLHRRGYRTQVAEASVRETLAAAVALQVLGARGGQGAPPSVIWDPFCGAGTLGIEALQMARGRLAGEHRQFSLQSWPTYDEAEFRAHKQQLVADASLQALAPDVRVILSDRDRLALESAEQNASQAGVLDGCQFEFGDLLRVAASIPEGAAIISNPPYGKRVAQGGALDALVHLLERRPDLRPCALLLGGPARRDLSPSFAAVLRTKNGGTPVSIRLLGRGQSP
jgi:putative N6-adenine-specific DNA methylase